MSAEFSDDLIRHCEQKALAAVAAGTADLVRAVLRASGHAELVAALDAIAKQKLAVEMDEAYGVDWEAGYEGCVKRARAALAAAGQPQGSGEADDGP